MESIKQMVNRRCPEGIEFYKLGEVCEIKTGKGITKKDAENAGDYPIISGGVTPMGYFHLFNREPNVVTVSRVGANAGWVGYMTEKFYLNDKCFSVIPNEANSNKINPKYLYYYLKQNESTLTSLQSEGGVPTINTQKVGSVDLPLPPMEIQNRIVEVLDKMTSLTAELEAELEARKQQYEYYRNRLLTLGGVNWKKISEIALYPKARIKSEMLTVDTYVGVESLVKNRGGKTSSSSVPEGAAIEFLPQDILIGNIRPYLKKIWLSDCQGGTNGDVICIRVIDSKEIMPKFLYYILASDTFFVYDNSHAKGGKMPRGDKNAILAYEIPVPSMDEQARIVSILDRFEALTTDLQTGLPAEIEARRQQYEYYRNKLLTFNQIA